MLFFAVAALLAASCGEEFKYGGDNPVSLELGVNSLDFPAAAGEAKVPVNASGTWSASADADWITAAPAADSLAVTVTANPDIYTRRAFVTVISGNTKVLLEVVQGAMPLDLTIGAAALNFGCGADSSSFVVKSNVEYVVKGPAWISAQTVEDTLTICVSDNVSLFSRSSDVYLWHGEEIVGSVSVTQDPVVPVMSFGRVLSQGITVQSEESSDTLSLSSNWPWSFTAPSWLTIPLPKEAGEDGLVPAGDYVLTFTCPYSKYDRDSVIAFRTASKEYNMPFKQLGVPISLTLSKTSYTAPYSKDTLSLTVTASDSWTLGSLPAWITSNVDSGEEGETELILYIEKNSAQTQRTATVSVICHTKTAKLSITQKECGRSVSIVFGDGTTAYRTVLKPSLGSSMANGYNLGVVERQLTADPNYVLEFYSRGTTLTSTGSRGLRIKIVYASYAHDKELRAEDFGYIKIPAIDGMKITTITLKMYSGLTYNDFYVGTAAGPTNDAAKASAAAVLTDNKLVPGENVINITNPAFNTPYYLLMFNTSVEYDFLSITIGYSAE